jgi:hypothetical protein
MNCKPYPGYKEIGTQWRFDRDEIDQWMKAHATGRGRSPGTISQDNWQHWPRPLVENNTLCAYFSTL